MNQYIYLDHAATTKPYQDAVNAMIPYLQDEYGNPSSMYGLSLSSRRVISQTRDEIAKSLSCMPREIYFTSGGSEADNWALVASAESMKEKGNHIITTKIEHHAILHTLEYLQKRGFEVTYLDVDGEGMVDPKLLETMIKPTTILVSIMFANNEIGTIEPIAEIGEICRKHDVLFHTDAVQAYGHMKIDLQKLHVDMLSASAHKLGGPKGIGFLYIRNGVKLTSFIRGGSQERGRRAGTENVPAIAGFGAAVKQCFASLDERTKQVQKLRDYLISRVLTEIPESRLNGPECRNTEVSNRLPGNTNFSFTGVEGETMLIMLDMKKICASSGSACATGSVDPSHVLMAIGLTREEAKGSLRMTLGHENTKEEIDIVVDVLKEIVTKLRR